MNMNLNLKYTLMGVLALSITACASTPKEDVITIPKPVEEVVEAPVIAKPVPAAPVVQEPAFLQPVGPVAGTKEHFKYISGQDRVYFAYNSYDLAPQARDVLRLQAGWLKTYPTSILVIGGNADERGTREYNLALGARRADSVKAFLVSQGVAPSRITTVSYGKERPIDGGSNEAAWALNRNAHSAVLVGSSS